MIGIVLRKRSQCFGSMTVCSSVTKLTTVPLRNPYKFDAQSYILVILSNMAWQWAQDPDWDKLLKAKYASFKVSHATGEQNKADWNNYVNLENGGNKSASQNENFSLQNTFSTHVMIIIVHTTLKYCYFCR